MLYASSYEIDRLKSSADIIEEFDALTTYLGLCLPGTAETSEPKWTICKITQSQAAYPILTTVQWADGLAMFNKVWDNRAGYTYTFKKF